MQHNEYIFDKSDPSHIDLLDNIVRWLLLTDKEGESTCLELSSLHDLIVKLFPFEKISIAHTEYSLTRCGFNTSRIQIPESRLMLININSNVNDSPFLADPMNFSCIAGLIKAAQEKPDLEYPLLAKINESLDEIVLWNSLFNVILQFAFAAFLQKGNISTEEYFNAY